jgi:hypothetical protein
MAYTLCLSLLFLATLSIILWDNGFFKRIFSNLLIEKPAKAITSVQASEFDTRMSNKELCYVANQRDSNHAEKINEESVKKTGKAILSSSDYSKIEDAAFDLFSEQEVEPNEC